MGRFFGVGVGLALAALAIEAEPVSAQFSRARSQRGQSSSRAKLQCPPGTVPVQQQPYCPPPTEFAAPSTEMSPIPSSGSEQPTDPNANPNGASESNPNTTDSTDTANQQPQTPPSNITDQAANAAQQNNQSPNTAFRNFDRGGSSDIGRGAAPFAGDFLGLTSSGSLNSQFLATPPGTILSGPSLNIAGFGGPGVVTLTDGRVLNGATLVGDVQFTATSVGPGLYQLTPLTNKAGFDNWISAAAGEQLQPGNALVGSVDSGAIVITGQEVAGDLQLNVDTQDQFKVLGFNPGDSVVISRTGSLVSRFKMSEQVSAIPRDRFILNYGGYTGVRNVGGVKDVNRVVAGFERTIFDDYTSIEVRLPFASTFNSNQIGGLSTGSNTELGNLAINYKEMIFQSDTLFVSVGAGLELPTADDIVVSNSAVFLRRSSESVHLLPFVSSLYTPNDKVFLQSYLQLSYDTNGETVFAASTNNTNIPASTASGVVQEPTMLFAGVGGGYWLYRRQVNSAFDLSGVAGIMEMHFTQTLQDPDTFIVPFGQSYAFGQTGEIAVANLTAGTSIELGQQSLCTIAYSVPLTDTDRQFDGELQVQMTYYFDKAGTNNVRPARLR